ncbi:Unknown protein [Striga hermonthica]|uniref:Uncharacterized protein n=1 Tax=Striga hermonthica TaxID=68872 RepID=A0A9N7MK62_STRHE|nr:Unknown protein [Striga hermonthica]
MLDYTIELISLAASNSHAVFCFCNLIIAIILIGSSKPSSQFDETKPNHGFSNIASYENFKKVVVVSSCVKAQNDSVEAENEKATPVCVDVVVDEDEEDENEKAEQEDENEQVEQEDDADEDDDELRKRVEDFIEKVNRAWRAEKMKTYSLGQ